MVAEFCALDAFLEWSSLCFAQSRHEHDVLERTTRVEQAQSVDHAARVLARERRSDGIQVGPAVCVRLARTLTGTVWCSCQEVRVHAVVEDDHLFRCPRRIAR